MSSAPTFPPPAAWVACPKCAAQVPCYDPAGSRYFGCWQCRTYFRAVPEAGAGHLVSGFKRELPPGPALPLGATGTLGGYQVRLTGYQVRGEKQDRTAEWREYQLRPVQALAGDDPIDFPLQLAEFQGHWLLIRRATSFPANRNGKPYTDKEWTSPSSGNSYRLWHRYQPLIRDAQGEFDWNILYDEELKIQEFTCPPYLLSSEQAPREKPIWYLAEYLEPAQVAAAFGLNVSQLPSRHNTGAAEPNPHQPGPAWRLFGVAALLLLALAAWLAITRPSSAITQTFTVPATPAFTIPAAPAAAPPPADTVGQAAARATAAAAQPAAPEPPATPATAAAGYNQMLVSKTIELTHPAAIDITLSASGLTNHWLEVTASLVNEQTGRGYEVTRSLEYYEGVEDGESWREGDRSANAVISGLPAGRYHLNLYPSPEAGLGDTELVLELEQHTGFASNVVLVLLLMSILPLYQWARHGAFETSRWENSDFGPTSD
ncbi:MAG TPA: hypothetical protein VFO93_11190 [Hymenobacter sp.]|uniref:hypothetical protein n=1 Tax=Hymenobacter sp. TaxID=1898978 RepID=UPI002D8021F9|nr:hypothetical protein [Hymenobacter sp.]HET9504099.1 hypothetical protein [Hymenobacter sp.]